MSESKTSEKRLAAAERQRQALELRKAGVGFEAIAERLGYAGPSGAYQAVMAALKKTLQEPADELKKLELERLDAAQLAIYNSVKQGNLGAVDRLLRVMERRARLLGLDGPERKELSGPDGEPVRIQAVGAMGAAGATDSMGSQQYMQDAAQIVRLLEARLAAASPTERAALLAVYEALVNASNALQNRLQLAAAKKEAEEVPNYSD